MPAAYFAAAAALADPKCSGLFGTADTRNNGWDPTDILADIITGTKYGSVKFAEIGTNNVATTVPAGRLPIPGLAGSVLITINSHDDPNYNFWNNASTMEQAETLLHELGHAYNFLRGSGGFAISNLREIRDPYAFDKVVNENCFGSGH
jgi:hypothetical protein